jgi:spermidine synthase
MDAPRYALTLVVFFLSGAASLVYEVVWMRELTLIFGATVYAAAAVLAAFMAGLSLGSAVLGRRADRLANPLATYALLEVGIGVYALLAPYLFEGLRLPYVALYRLDLPYPLLALGRALLAALMLLPPTLLMGGTLPVLARFFVGLRRDVGATIGVLYFVNTLGAIAGCLVAGFLLIEALGLDGASRLAAALNFALAAGAALLARSARGRGAAAAEAANGEVKLARVPDAAARLALYAIGLSGFTALAYEVLWTRALLRYLYNSTYAFTTMLVSFLLGIAIGSWIYTRLPYRKTHPLRVFAALELVVGLGFLVSSLLFADLGGVAARLLGDDALRSFGDSLRRMFVCSVLILFVPALALGAAVPLATEICARRLARVGRTVGRVYAINTLGAILGSLAVPFLLIPWLGMQGTVVLLIAVNLGLAGALLMTSLDAPAPRLAAALGTVAVLVAVSWAMPADLFRRTFAEQPGRALIFYRE